MIRIMRSGYRCSQSADETNNDKTNKDVNTYQECDNDVIINGQSSSIGIHTEGFPGI